MSVAEILNFELFRIKDLTVTVGSLMVAIVILVIGRLISFGLQRALRRGWERRGASDSRNLHAGIRLAHYAIMLAAFAIALESVGVDLTTLFAAGAIFAIGIGFAMQNVAQNFVSGVILLMERTIRPGDLLEVDGTVVRVQQMGMRATLVRTRFEEEMIVPNSLLVQSTIKNFTLHDPLYRARTSVGVTYSSDIGQVFDILRKTAVGFSSRYAGREPVVLLTGFGTSSVDFEISVWTDDPWTERLLLSKLNEAVWWALKEAGIVIAFPQLDLHMDAEAFQALRAGVGLESGGKTADDARPDTGARK